VLSLIPLVANVFTIKYLGDSSSPIYPNEESLTMLQLASYKGELLLLAVGLSAAGISDAVDSLLHDNQHGTAKVLIIGFCLINVMFGCFVYAAISEVYRRDLGMHTVAVVTWVSLVSYTAAVFASAVCVALAGE